jgi:hypothetical protein
MREGHPVLHALDDSRQDALAIEYPYFEQREPMVWDEPGTYVETDAELANSLSHEWNQMELLEGGEYRLIDRPERLPHTFTVAAVKLG